MHGYQLVFFTQLKRTHGLLSIAEWLTKEAKQLGVSGVTVSVAQGGYGRDGKYQSARFFETGEQPIEVTMALGADKTDELFARISKEGLKVFYLKTPIEYGITGEE